MNKKHILLMLACCLIPILAIGAVTIFHVPFNLVLLYGMILLCPISHLFMMRGMMNGEGHDHEGHHDQAPVHNPSPSRTWWDKKAEE